MSRTLLLILAAIVLAGFCVCAPLCVYMPDFRMHWVRWEQFGAGFKPWNVYQIPEANYPPVVPYLLTPIEMIREVVNAHPRVGTNWLLVKLPNALAIFAGAAALYLGFKPERGTRRACALAAAWLTSISFFVNAALWCQWDVILALLLLLALMALRRGEHFRMGVWLALALGLKAQAIFLFPVIGVYLLARRAWKPISVAMLGAAATFVVIFVPMAVNGRLRESTSMYVSNLDLYPVRTMDAWNTWHIVDMTEVRLFDHDGRASRSDRRPVFGDFLPAFTYKKLGLLMLASYVFAVMSVTARRKLLADVIVGGALCGVAMFMHATQMHERYLVPPAGLMTLWLLLPRVYRVHFVYWTVVSGVNQLLVMGRENFLSRHFAMSDHTFETIGIFFAIANLLMFIHISWLFFSSKFESSTRGCETTLSF